MKQREKKLLVSSSDFGKDLYGVQRLIRNHEQLEDELVTHETTLRVRIKHSRQSFFSIITTLSPQHLLSRGEDLVMAEHFALREIQAKCSQLQEHWQELGTFSAAR